MAVYEQFGGGYAVAHRPWYYNPPVVADPGLTDHAWVVFDPGGSPDILSEYNVDSVTEAAGVVFTVTFTDDFSSAVYVIAASSRPNTAGTGGGEVIGISGGDATNRFVGSCKVEGAGTDDDYVSYLFTRNADKWVALDAADGSPEILDDFEVDSITDNAAGDYTIVWEPDFASAVYVVGGTGVKANSTVDANAAFKIYNGASNPAAGTLRIFTIDFGGNRDFDVVYMSVMAIADTAETADVTAWCIFDAAGTITADLNADSVTDNAEGDWTVNWEPDFPDEFYVVSVTDRRNTSAGTTDAQWPTLANVASNPAAGTTRIRSVNQIDGVLRDDESMHVMATVKEAA